MRVFVPRWSAKFLVTPPDLTDKTDETSQFWQFCRRAGVAFSKVRREARRRGCRCCCLRCDTVTAWKVSADATGRLPVPLRLSRRSLPAVRCAVGRALSALYPRMKRPHPSDCRCPVHDLEPRRCPEIVNGERCEKVCRGPARIRLALVRQSHSRRKRKMQAVLVPSGTGYLQKLLRDPRSASRLDVSALPRFAQMLAQGQRSRKALRRSARAMLLEAQERPHDAFRNTLRMPGTIAEPIALLALLADVPVTRGNVRTALLRPRNGGERGSQV